MTLPYYVKSLVIISVVTIIFAMKIVNTADYLERFILLYKCFPLTFLMSIWIQLCNSVYLQATGKANIQPVGYV